MQKGVKVQSVYKRFRRFTARSRHFSEAVVRGWRRRTQAKEFWALYDVSFEVAPGRILGVVGRNGAGKSSLLKILGGVIDPTHGTVEVQGRLRALLELSASFAPDLTERENVFLSGVITGLTRREVAERFEAISARRRCGFGKGEWRALGQPTRWWVSTSTSLPASRKSAHRRCRSSRRRPARSCGLGRIASARWNRNHTGKPPRCIRICKSTIDSGDLLVVTIDYRAREPVHEPVFVVTICRQDGLVCYEADTASDEIRMGEIRGRGRIALTIERLDLNSEIYYADVGVYEPNWSHAYDYHWHVYPFEIRTSRVQKGVLRAPHRWRG